MVDPAKTIHDLEQGAQALVNMAIVLGEYHKKLLAEGFSKEEAFELVLWCQGKMLGVTRGPDD